MTCYHPIAAYQERQGGPVHIGLGPRAHHIRLHLPCSKCLGCKADKASSWGYRSDHEASRHEHNTMITLTYDDDHLPSEGHLVPRHLQLFLKRLRKHAATPRKERSLLVSGASGIRFLACGEYGTTNGRPHYHAILYNCGFADQFRVGKELYDSLTLQHLWSDKNGKPLGATRVAPATHGRAVYIAKYTIKQLTTHKGWELTNSETGECRPAPFARMSRRPAIGRGWIEKYFQDLQHGYLVHDGTKQAIPRYYKNYIKEHQPELHARIKQLLIQRSREPNENREPERLLDAEKIHQRLRQLNESRNL